MSIPNFFAQNRRKIQQYAKNIGFIKPIHSPHFDIIENKNKEGTGKLREISINNIPHDSLHERTWEVNFDIEESPNNRYIFNTPQGKKKVEKALIVLINKRLYIYMFEMKSEISHEERKENSLAQIRQKWVDTMERLSLLLTLYCPEHVYQTKIEEGEEVHFCPFDKVKITYTGILIYNTHSIPTLTTEENKTDIYCVFKGEKPRLHIQNELFGNEPLDLIFLKNETSDMENIRLDFMKDIFKKEIKDESLFCW